MKVNEQIRMSMNAPCQPATGGLYELRLITYESGPQYEKGPAQDYHNVNATVTTTVLDMSGSSAARLSVLRGTPRCAPLSQNGDG
jgi:hypothetical protein